MLRVCNCVGGTESCTIHVAFLVPPCMRIDLNIKCDYYMLVDSFNEFNAFTMLCFLFHMCTHSCPTSAGTKQLIEEGKVTAIEIPKGKSELGLSYCWCEDVVRHLLTVPDLQGGWGTPRNISF